MAPPQRSSGSSRPVRLSRMKVQSYNEESSSDEEPHDRSDSDEEALRRASLSLRPRRSIRSYREQSTDESLDEDYHNDAEAVVPVEAPTVFTYPRPEPAATASLSRAPRNRTVTGKPRTARSKRPSKNSRVELGRPLYKRKKTEAIESTFLGSGIIPPWHTLPYHILFDIFLRASYPLVEERAVIRSGSVKWLVDVALLCRAFHEPALAALYYSPPLIPVAKAHSLLNLLCQPKESLTNNYVNKIKELHIDVETVLVYKSGPTLGYFDLPRLIKRTPRVKQLRLYHKDDHTVGLPPWQTPLSKWSYSDALFSALADSQIRLRSWDWNSRFMETERLLLFILAKHQQPAFKHLRELRLLRIASEEYNATTDLEIANGREMILASALKELPDLHRLEFLECSIVNEHLLSNLPSTLTSLTISNCDEVTTSSFASFLATHGQHLRELRLNHNRHLSMSFIGGLAQSCSNLERLKMDLSIHDYSSYHDVEPHYKELLSPAEVPTWPSTLQEIELTQLRNWDDTAAEVFFTSLIDAAPDLRNLRRLVISAILKIGWRDRASFREKWIGKLEKVFLRRSNPPDPSLCTIQRFPPPLALQAVAASTTTDDRTHSDTYTGGETGSAASTPSKRKSARIAERKISEAEAGIETKTPSPANDMDRQPVFVQGLCDVVMIRIDNQRPTEMQFNEDDFLDDEQSGDEDWTGNDIDVADETHAW